jgi:hypothetical protein
MITWTGDTMSRMIFAAALAAIAAMPQGAAAARPEHGAVVDGRALELGVLQQGKGGGKQDDGGGRAQGGGNDRGGRDEARPSGERRQGGGQSARTERRQQPDRAESSRGRASSSETRGNGSSGGRSDDARESRGNGSSSSASSRSERGSSSASSRGENGSGNGASSASSRSENGAANRASNATTGAARASDGRGRRDRLSGQALQARINELPQGLRRMATSGRPSERMAVGAIARGRARGLDADAFDVRSDGGRLRVLNRSGLLLLDLDDDRARDLGAWRLRRLGDRQPTGNAPAFCRSGAGHPVHGRQWCLDKGFGLGSRNGTVWSRGGIDDVIWRRRTDDRLDRGGLAGVLGDVIFGRLALQAITLGYDQPLVGFWVAQPEGPRILRVHSGDYEVAEFVDTDRDDRADVLYVVQPVW